MEILYERPSKPRYKLNEIVSISLFISTFSSNSTSIKVVGQNFPLDPDPDCGSNRQLILCNPVSSSFETWIKFVTPLFECKKIIYKVKRELTTTCLQRPIFWGPVFNFKPTYEQHLPTCQQRPQNLGPNGGRFKNCINLL